MDIQQIKALLERVHTFEGRLIEYVTCGDAAGNSHVSLQKEAEELLLQMTVCGLTHDAVRNDAEDLSKTLSSMYEQDDTATNAVGVMHEPSDMDDCDNDVKPIVSPAWQAVAPVSDVMPENLMPAASMMPAGDGEDEYYDDEDDDNLEVYEEDEDDLPLPGTEGKHPDLSYITINERARFRNHIFGGSKEKFDEAMRVLESLNGYKEAESYICNDLEFSPESDDVQAEFLEKIHECFRLAR